jgi:protein-disulfide isomerase
LPPLCGPFKLQKLFRNKLVIGALVALGLVLLAARWRYPQETLAEIDGAVITASQVDEVLRQQLSQLNQQIYNLKRQKLDELIDAQLLTEEAKRAGVAVATLMEREVDDKKARVSEEEIRAFYETHKDRLRAEYDKIHDQVRDYLNEQRREARKNEFFKTLRARAKIATYLKPPPALRADVSIDGAPIRGEKKAPVTIVKFEDFHCPFCKTVQPTFKELLKKYGGKVRLVHKDLPLDELHPEARQAAEAARCAGDQGKFWEYHDVLYANAPKASPADLKSYAQQLGLKVESFDDCLSRGKARAAIQKDRSEAARLGLNGTPAFFINGRELSGAQPIEAFAAIIDDELARSK